ncbi:hypothetical protein DER71_10648, partial [Halanaerobium sp. DL-01]
YFSVGLRYILEIVDYDVDIMKQKVDTIIPERILKLRADYSALFLLKLFPA